MKDRIKKALCFLKGHEPTMRVVEDWNEEKRRRFYSGVAYECTKCEIQFDYKSLVKYTFGSEYLV